MSAESASLSFHVSDVRVEVRCDHGPALRGLRAVWGRARPVMASARTVRGDIVREGEGGVVRLGELEQRQPDPADLLPAFEAMLYEAMPEWHPAPRVILHAAAVVVGETVVVLPGASGAGKSSIALALVERGGQYLTDELTVFDGRRLWGITRAPQFDAVGLGTVLPARLAAADVASYRFREHAGPAVLPLFSLDSSQVAAATFDATHAVVITPREDAAGDALDPLAPADALTQLLAGRRTEVATDLGPLLTRPSRRLRWRDPQRAADLVMAAFG